MAMMASACVNKMGVSPESFLDGPPPYSSFGWLSPRLSLNRELPEDELTAAAAKQPSPPPANPAVGPDPEGLGKDTVADFEFRLEDPVAMLPADELFSDGKLVPLQVSYARPAATMAASAAAAAVIAEARAPPEAVEVPRRMEAPAMDPSLFSPKAPRCSSRWKELLGLRKLYQQSNGNGNGNGKQEIQKPNKSIKHFLNRHTKSSSSSSDPTLNLPLLRDSDSESVSISSRLSLSSSSSGHDFEDLPGRHSLDSDKPSHNPNPSPATGAISLPKNSNPARVRVMKHRAAAAASSSSDHHLIGSSGGRMGRRAQAPESGTVGSRVASSVDSPRMNSSGKVVFQSLERSSSSPSSFNGGPRFKHRPGIERSYSANVRVTPVLNVPVCSLRGSSKSGVFGFFSSSSPQKREAAGGAIRTHHHHHHHSCRSRQVDHKKEEKSRI